LVLLCLTGLVTSCSYVAWSCASLAGFRPFFLPCPVARALHCPTLPCCPHALQPARCPACAALQPARCPALQPARRPCSPRPALWQPACRPFAALLALPCLRRPAAAAAAAARATAAAGAGGAGPTIDCASESATALGASESVAALGARESAPALGARAPPTTGPFL
ncbi:unnamed protein product, partial [Closterium sp. NIES-53]